VIERLKQRINFLTGWIAHLRKAPDTWETGDKIYQLEEELNIKAILLKRLEQKTAEQAQAEEGQKKELLSEGRRMLDRLRGVSVEEPKIKEFITGVLERDLKGSHSERWSDYMLARQIVEQYSRLTVAK
jgi:hypothetical protein